MTPEVRKEVESLIVKLDVKCSVKEFVDGVDWDCISQYQKLSEDFIREFADRVKWIYISKSQKLSEEFIREFSDRVKWIYISKSQKLSEEFIREFADRVNWCWISTCQKLSEDFIREFADRVNWSYISTCQKLSEDFRKEFKLKIPDTCWLYQDREFKRAKIAETGLYEMDGDYVIAFKSVRDDFYSCYNFQYFYEVGKTYAAHADHNINNQNSFGLSAWTKEQALGYHNNGKLLKVRIHLDDLAAIVHNGGKLRASKMEIVSVEAFIEEEQR